MCAHTSIEEGQRPSLTLSLTILRIVLYFMQTISLSIKGAHTPYRTVPYVRKEKNERLYYYLNKNTATQRVRLVVSHSLYPAAIFVFNFYVVHITKLNYFYNFRLYCCCFILIIITTPYTHIHDTLSF